MKAVLPQRYHQLDALRGIAALIVVLFHAWMTVPWPEGNLLQPLDADTDGLAGVESWFRFTPLRVVTAGPAAVGLFFALSGLVLALPWVRGRPPQWTGFLVKRLFRLYVPFAVAILVAALLHRLSAPAPIAALSAWFNSSWTAPPTADLLAGHLLMFGTQPHMSLDNVMWSLVHEARISLLFPLLVVATLAQPWRSLLLAAALMAILSMPVLSDWRMQQLAQADGYWMLATVLDTARYTLYFVAGILLAARMPALVAGFGRLTRTAHALLWLVAAALLLLRVPYYSDLAWVAGSVLVIGLSLSSALAGRVLAHAALAWLGRVSYSLYLVHVPVLLAIVHFGHARWPLPGLLALYLPLALLAADGFHRLVEAPCQRLGHRIAGRFRSGPAGGLVAARER